MPRPRDSQADIPRGTILDGKFRVERVLGKGGMGVVLEATHLALGQPVAIKLLHEGADEGSETHRRFVQEAQVASGIVSDNVVRVFDLGRTPDGAPYIVMELLRGQDLATVIASESPLTLPRAVDLALGACQGVAAAHAAGLVHRDLKPANLFLAVGSDGSRSVKVVDFGLSKVVSPGAPAMTASASSFGTPQYMAPEQIASVKHVDARCDQHALAMVLYELLTARPPYEGPTAAAIAVKIATHPPPSARDLRREIPKALDEAVRKALAKQPDDRFEDLGAFACAIAPFGGPASVSAAAKVQATLAPTARARLGRRSAAEGDGDATTVPLGAQGELMVSADSQTGLSSSLRRMKARSAFGLGLVAALTLAASGLALVLVFREPAPTSAVPAAAPPIPPAAAPTPSTALAPSPSPEKGPAASATASAASAPTAAPTTKAAVRPPRTPARPPAANTNRDPGDVFGTRRNAGGRR